MPQKNLALEPAVPRDSSKLFIYETAVDKIIFDHFYNIDKYLSKNSFMVLNDTKVLPARVSMKKENGGKVILLFLVNELVSSQVVRVLTDRKITIGEKLYFPDDTKLKIISQNENIFEVKFDFTKQKLFSLLEKYGTMPIPPYLKKSPLTRDELLDKYQTVFAKNKGSSAAPTAALHFTDKVFEKLDKSGIEKYFITLHVGLGTFAPISDENIKQKKLHEEYYEINRNMWKQIKINRNKGKKLVAVGTTVVRTLESEARQRNFLAPVGTLPAGSGESQVAKNLPPLPLKSTNLFIFPPYDFKLVDIMLTNFHLPKSSLMMLVEAFLQHKESKKSLVELYNIAIKNNFRFYSFGDAMLIL